MLLAVVLPDDFAVDLPVLDLSVVVFDEPDEPEAFVVAEPEDLAVLESDESVEEAADESVDFALPMVDVGLLESSSDESSVEEASDFDCELAAALAADVMAAVCNVSAWISARGFRLRLRLRLTGGICCVGSLEQAFNPLYSLAVYQILHRPC